MWRARKRMVLIAALATLAMPLAHGQSEDEHAGIIEYEIACMPCHGPEGRGDGPDADKLARPPADLTRIVLSNGGRFPFERIVEMVDGRADVAAHGARDMPVWGNRYRSAGDEIETREAAEARTRAQISALVRYLVSIQAP